MAAHLSSQLLEGIPDTSCLAGLDKLIVKLQVQMSNPISLSQYIQWREIEE